MSSPFATPKKPATDALLHPPGSAVGIAIAAANEAQGKDGLDSVHAQRTSPSDNKHKAKKTSKVQACTPADRSHALSVTTPSDNKGIYEVEGILDVERHDSFNDEKKNKVVHVSVHAIIT